MGLVLSNLFNSLWGNDEVRILMVGLDGAGKTTVLFKFKLGETVTTIPTIGFNVETIQYKNVNFTVWDVGGQERIRQLWRHYYQGTNGLIFVVDSNDRERVDVAREELHGILREDEMQDVCLLVMANKQDCASAMTSAELGHALSLTSIRHPWFIQGTVATTGDGLYEGMDWLVKTLKNKKK